MFLIRHCKISEPDPGFECHVWLIHPYFDGCLDVNINQERREGDPTEKIGSVEILTVFFSTLLGATARNAEAPAAVASLLSDNSREGNTTQSYSTGGGSGGQALSPPIIGDSQLLKY